MASSLADPELTLLAYQPDTVTMSGQRAPLQVSSREPADEGARTITGGADTYYDDFAAAMTAFLQNRDTAGGVYGGGVTTIGADEDDWLATVDRAPTEPASGGLADFIVGPGPAAGLAAFIVGTTDEDAEPPPPRARDDGPDEPTAMAATVAGPGPAAGLATFIVGTTDEDATPTVALLGQHVRDLDDMGFVAIEPGSQPTDSADDTFESRTVDLTEL
jgi:hypothetical protein